MPMTISITLAIEEKLNLVAALTNRDKNAVLESLISESVNEKLRRLAAVQEGLDDVEAGRTVDHEEAMREIRAEIARVRAAQS